MTVLIDIIEKAQKNGYCPEWKFSHTDAMGYSMTLRKQAPKEPGVANVTHLLSVDTILFDHTFAAAIWPDDDQVYYGQTRKTEMEWQITELKRWQYHLQQMVLAEDPIAYLESNT